MRIGYSFWGFLGAGITDTPDGGRSHRRPLLDALTDRGHEVVLLQANRDLTEAGERLPGPYGWDGGLPDLDRLVLEWRWPIQDRNTTPCGSPGHTCDLHRQAQLLRHYADGGLPTVIWDKDLRLAPDDPLREHANVTVAEAALRPSPGAHTLLFPVPDRQLDDADPQALSTVQRDLPLVYIGNQYGRDDAFNRYFAPAAQVHRHQVTGKWPDTAPWPHVTFTGRVAFPEVSVLYGRAVCTVLLLPARYRRAAQMTQRLLEAVLRGCLPLTPMDIADAGSFTPRELHVSSGGEAAEKITTISRRIGSPFHQELIARCLAHLEPFRLSHQVEVLTELLEDCRSAEAARP